MPHDLDLFMNQSAETLSAEYNRIRARATQDPGTAGDEGEENWRELLQSWLPADLIVRTKGRIIGTDGSMSKQVDVVVLRPEYPRALLEKKTYLAAGVLAAFECKLTIKPAHIAEAAENARLIRALATSRTGTLYDESHSPIIFGVLAHSTALRRTPKEDIDALLQIELDRDSSPSDILDVLCIAKLSCWFGWVSHLPKPVIPEGSWQTTRRLHRLEEVGGTTSGYMRFVPELGPVAEPAANPLFVLMNRLHRRFAWEEPRYRALSQYLTLALGSGNSAASVATRAWPFDYLSDEVRQRVVRGGVTNLGWQWDRWGVID